MLLYASRVKLDQNREMLSISQLQSQSHATNYTVKEINDLLRPSHSLETLPVALSKSKYFQLAKFMQEDEQINSAPTDQHYERHLFRMKQCLKSSKGLSLDIGCGDPDIGAALLSTECKYLGIDPFANVATSKKLVGAAEDLPFVNACFDSVIFNTSLDHVLDYKLALLEARRVLRPDGLLFISTLFWVDEYSLLNDRVHFHHFHEFEILGALQSLQFTVNQIARYSYKNDDHRYGAYIRCRI